MDFQQTTDTVQSMQFQNFKGPTALSFYGNSGKLVVSISTADGSVTFGDGVTPTEAARQFWEQIKRLHPEICR